MREVTFQFYLFFTLTQQEDELLATYFAGPSNALHCVSVSPDATLIG